MSCWAIVPIKERASCKGRLASYLSPGSRRELVDQLLTNVVRALRSTRSIDRIAVVSPELQEIAGVLLLPRVRVGLNEDLDFAVRSVMKLGAGTILIVLPDLPFLETGDLTALLEGVRHRGAAIAPDRRELGTNGLAFRSCDRFPLSFGKDSFCAHVARSRERGIEPAIVRRAGLAFDVDEPADFRHLSQYPNGSGSPEMARRRHAVV